MKATFAATLIALIVLAASALPAPASDGNPPYYQERTTLLPNGESVTESIISGPPQPPPGYEPEAVTFALAQPAEASGSKLLPVPTYEWFFGCSATSAAMIAAYYDRSGLGNMYTGPANGGVMPMESNLWGTWTDGSGSVYTQCPLAASRSGLDGRTAKGSIDDYWVAYGSSAADPYVGNWTPHAWGNAIGDYMTTSQSAHANIDGATSFWNYTSSSSRLTCETMATFGYNDGTLGRRLFYEARGHTVTDCYNQKTDNNKGGFTFALYKAEIDAGRPVMLNLKGHTVVGVGYDDAGTLVYLHDTWNNDLHSMTWGGSYSGMELQSVSIANPVCVAPADVGNLAVTRLDAGRVELRWSAAAGAHHYEVWSAANQPYFTPGADCGNPAPLKCSIESATSMVDSALGDPTANYAYTVTAVRGCGSRSVSPSGRVAEFEYELKQGN